jgi:transposase
VVGYFLLHCGLGLQGQMVGAALELGSRALTTLKGSSPEQLLASLRRPKVGRKPKLRPAHLGPLCRFLVEQPQATLPEVRRFLRSTFGIAVHRHALRRYFRRYSLGVLREERASARPLFAVAPPTRAPSSCSARLSA